MSTNRFVKSKLYRFLDYVLRLILLNFLAVIPSFLLLFIYSFFSKDTTSIWFYLTLVPMIVWFFPAFIAITDVIRQYEDNTTNTIFKDFFKSFRKHFFKAFIVGIILYLFVILFYNSFQFFNINQSRGIIYLFGLILTISFMFVVIYLCIHLPLVLVYFTDLSFFQYFKLALIMAFKDFGTTFLMAIVIIVLGTLSLLYNYVMFLGGISVTVYFLVKLSFRQYIKIYRKVENNND